jgi:amino acid adenylation domain-containing protein
LDVSLQQGDSGLEIRNVRSLEQTNYPLTLVVVPGSELSLQISYDRDRFDAATISRMLKHFQTLLESMVNNWECCLSDLSILTEVERHQLLVNWNDIHAEYPQDKCIHQLFEEQVERTPDAVAVVFEEQQLTYRELNSRANRLAHYLQGLGVGTEVLVGICVERSPEMIIGLLGILKAGGAYVPLDPSYPQERLAFMLEDSQVSFILTQQSLISSLPEHHAKVICLDSDSLWERYAERDAIEQYSIQSPSSLAYVIYTSGSTGKPKGVLVSHENVARLFSATQNWFNFNERDTWTLFHSYAFDFSVWEIWGALLYGGRLIVVPYWVSRSPETFYDLLCKERVTVLNQTPSAFRQLIRVEESASTTQELSLRLVIFGGEALELQSLKPWFERHGDRSPELVNMYGITETTVHVTYRPLTIADLNSTGSVIGRPIPDLQVYILDRHLQPVPIGVPGELHIGGIGLARGYLNRPDLTAQKFINFELPIGDLELNSEDQSNPKSKIENPKSIRLYKSGDLARYLPNGDIEYLGRIDNQVKIRGFRIELGEIEAILARHPNVWENAIVDWEDGTGDKRLVAYVVPNGEQPTTCELWDFLKQQLPDHMIPSAFVMLESLPLTPNGKVDRRVLPAPDTSRRSVAEGFIAPRNSTEETLARLWAEVLGVDRVSIYDNFFALGGHSLRATQLMSRLKQTFSVELPLRTLFESPTLIELAELVVARQLEQADSDALEQILSDVNALSEHEAKQLNQLSVISRT